MVYAFRVALRKESVDRNITIVLLLKVKRVALRKESVDRNQRRDGLSGKLRDVALRKESVDRNAGSCTTAVACISRSPQGERG